MANRPETGNPVEKTEEKVGFFKCKKRDRGASEDRLITAGLEIFSKYGFNGATTKMIAKKADVNESLIGRYFDGKEGLLIAIIQRFIGEITGQELKYPPQDSLAAELELYVQNRIQEGCIHEDFAKLIISHALVDKKFKKRLKETVTMQIDPKLTERIQRLYDLGKLNSQANVEQISEDIDTFLDGVFFFERILNETPFEELVQRTVGFVKRYALLFDKK